MHFFFFPKLLNIIGSLLSNKKVLNYFFVLCLIINTSIYKIYKVKFVVIIASPRHDNTIHLIIRNYSILQVEEALVCKGQGLPNTVSTQSGKSSWIPQRIC